MEILSQRFIRAFLTNIGDQKLFGNVNLIYVTLSVIIF